jgi:hypothetical protein
MIKLRDRIKYVCQILRSLDVCAERADEIKIGMDLYFVDRDNWKTYIENFVKLNSNKEKQDV